MENKNYKIYEIRSPDDDVYIGQTGIDPEKRWGGGGLYEKSSAIGQAISKYGWKNMSHEVIMENLTSDEADIAEDQFIQSYGGIYDPKVLNQKTGGKKNYTVSREVVERRKKTMEDPEVKKKFIAACKRRFIDHPELRDKMSEIKKKMHEDNPSIRENASKKVVQYSYDGTKEIARYKSISEAARNVGISDGHISECLSGTRTHAGGYVWKPDDGKKYPLTFFSKRPITPVAQIDMTTNKIIAAYDSVKEASDKTGINRSCINACVTGRRNQSGGYKWEYYPEQN